MDDTLSPALLDDTSEFSNHVTLTIKDDSVLQLLFVGDTSFGENYQEQIKHRGGNDILETKGYAYPLEKMKEALVQSDLVIANLETPLTNLKSSPFSGGKKYLHWSDPLKASEHLLAHKIRIVNLANNHMLDYGRAGLEETFLSLKKIGITYFGAGNTSTEAENPCIINIDNGTKNFHIALIGAYEENKLYRDKYDFYADKNKSGVQVLTVDKILNTVKKIKKQYPNAIIIVSPHWGSNYKWKTKQQHNIAQQLCNEGVDLIIGHGSHMLQEIDNIKGHWVINSLGNFMFNSPGRYTKMNAPPYSFITKLLCTIKNDILDIQIRLYPIVTDNKKTNYQSRFTTTSEFQEVCQLLDRSEGNPIASAKRDTDNLGHFIDLPFYFKSSPSSLPQSTTFPFTQPDMNLNDNDSLFPPSDAEPYIGLLCNLKMNQSVHDQFIPWVCRSWVMEKVFKQHHLKLFIYGPRTVDINAKKAVGYLIENGNYVLRLMDIPPLNYDWCLHHRAPGLSMREYHEWAKENNIQIYPSLDIAKLAGDKYKAYKAIQQFDDTIQAYSEIFNDQKQIHTFFEKNNLLLLKPRYGSRGRGILFIETGTGERGEPYYLLNWFMGGDERREIIFESFIELMKKVKAITKDNDYIIQVGIHSLRHQGSAFHIRVIMIHDGKEWQWAHEVRCGNHYSAISTFPFLGESFALLDFLKPYFDKTALTCLMDQLRASSLRIIQGLDSLYEHEIGELAFDYVIDTHYHFYLVEINVKPGVIGDPSVLPNFFQNEQYSERTQLYLHHLAQFFKNKMGSLMEATKSQKYNSLYRT
jgi:poly-gamma-glutamate capsule biosynthesis protein CapA/YwtB (metallophosphatase superfamily)